MPAPYTESFSGTVARVWPGEDFPRKPASVIMRDALRTTSRFYTWDAWTASFCDQAASSQRPITLEYSVTNYGKLITAVDYAQPELEATP